MTDNLRTFTVYGVWNNDGPGQDTDELIIAAVVEGDHRPVDDGEGSDFTRYCTVVQAADAREAETKAGLEDGRGRYSYAILDEGEDYPPLDYCTGKGCGNTPQWLTPDGLPWCGLHLDEVAATYDNGEPAVECAQCGAVWDNSDRETHGTPADPTGCAA